NGKILNSVFAIHQKMYNDKIQTKAQFKVAILKEIDAFQKFLNDNATELSKIGYLAPFYTNNQLNPSGLNMATEYTINNIVNGYNINEVFLPGVKGTNITK